MGKKINNRGIAVIILALSLAVLIAIVALAVDIGYMYITKGQLQNAADAVALAGAETLLSDSTSINQPIARQQAVAIAAKNNAAGTPVTLDQNYSGGTQNPNGDVVLGNWDPTRPQSPVDLRFLPTPDGSNPLPAGTFINAVKAVARRTGETGTGIAPNNMVSIFFGKVINWSQMAAKAQAIAQNPLPTFVTIPLCQPTCGSTTMLDGTSKFYFKTSDGTPNTGWTTFTDNVTSATNVQDYITGQKQPPNLCQLLQNPPACIYTNQGIITPDMCKLIEQIRLHSRTYTVGTTTVTGWKVFIPILDSSSPNPCPHTGSGCIGDPGYQPGDAYPFVQLAEAIITDAVAQGNCSQLNPPNQKGSPAVIFVGTGPPAPGVPGSSTIQCQTCDTVGGDLSNIVKLVK